MLVNINSSDQLPDYYERYITNIIQSDVDDFYRDLDSSLVYSAWSSYALIAKVAYAPGKWTVIELLQHIADTERVFQYRALMVARSKALVKLSEFDEDEFSIEAKANRRDYNDVLDEFILVRKSTIGLFHSFDESLALNAGIVNESRFNLNQLGLMIVGHYVHHHKILTERYRPLI